MNITITLNGKKISEEIDADLLLIDFCAESRLLQCKARM